MSTNHDINMAQGFVTSEPTGDGIKLYANDVDITNEIGGSSLPAVTAEDNGDVLTVVDGAWAKAAPSGAIGSFSAWNTQMLDVAFVIFEATDLNSADVCVVCSDGEMLGSIHIEQDAETNDRRIVWGEWLDDLEDLVPNYTQYINTIQENIIAEVGEYLETSNSPFGEPPSEPGEPFGPVGYQIPFMIMRR